MAPSLTLGHLAFYALLVFGLVAIMLGLSALLGQRTRLTKDGLLPYESGIISTGSAQFRFSAKFYLAGILFVIFDLEAAYVITWAVAVRETGWAGYIEMMIFLGLLTAALVYLWLVGALDWAPKKQKPSDRHY